MGKVIIIFMPFFLRYTSPNEISGERSAEGVAFKIETIPRCKSGASAGRVRRDFV